MNRFLILFLFCSLNTFSQFQLLDKEKEEKTFRVLNRPSPTNKLSKFLRENLTYQEIIALDYSTAPNTENSIRAQFQVDAKGNPFNFRIYTGKKELNDKLRKLLKEFLKNEIPDISNLFQARNRIQLFSRVNNKNVINASSIIVSDYPPKCKDCRYVRFDNGYSCFKNYLEYFIINNLNHDLIKKERVTGELKLNISFKIDKEGNIKDIICNSSNTKIVEEVKRILQLFQSKITGVAKRNGVPFDSFFSGTIVLLIKETFTKEEISTLENNDFTKFFRQKIEADVIKKVFLYPNNLIIKVFFSYNQKGELFDVWTNTESVTLSERIIKAFKKYPLETLTIDKSINKIYSLGVIRNIDEGYEILCDNSISYTSLRYANPCPNCKNYKQIIAHNFNEIQNYIISEFNTKNTSYKIKKASKKDEEPIFNLEIGLMYGGTLYFNSMTINDSNGVAVTQIKAENDYDSEEYTLKDFKGTPINEKNVIVFINETYYSIMNNIKSIIDSMPKYKNIPFYKFMPYKGKIKSMDFKLIEN